MPFGIQTKGFIAGLVFAMFVLPLIMKMLSGRSLKKAM